MTGEERFFHVLIGFAASLAFIFLIWLAYDCGKEEVKKEVSRSHASDHIGIPSSNMNAFFREAGDLLGICPMYIFVDGTMYNQHQIDANLRQIITKLKQNKKEASHGR